MKIATNEKRQTWPYVKEVTYANGVRAHSVDCRTKEGGKRYFFPTKALAEAHAQMERTARSNMGATYSMDSGSRFDAAEAIKALRDAGLDMSLTEAIRFCIANTRVIAASKTVAEVIAERYTRIVEIEKLKPRSVSGYVYMMRGFSAVFGDRQIATITTNEVRDYIEGKDLQDITKNTIRKSLNALFNFAVVQHYVVANPMVGLKDIKIPIERVGIYSVAQVRALLETAVRIAPECVPMLALNAFAGVRPEAETDRLDWKYIDMESGAIDIEGHRSKNSMSDRIITMEPNLIAWLKPFAKASGEICNRARYMHLMRLVKVEAGVVTKDEKWIQDGLRHTFASLHIKKHNNPILTAQYIGHGDSIDMLVRKYRNGKATVAEAAVYWEIYPTIA